MRKPDYPIAVSALTDEGFGWNHNEDKLEWPDTNTGDAPTKLEIDAKLVELEKEFSDNEYARNRVAEYPSLLELTVALYDTDDKSAVEAKRASVKLKYPKPE